MNELTYRYQQLTRTHEHLVYRATKYRRLATDSPSYPDTDSDREDDRLARRDGLIKRFEITYRLMWKLLKVILRDHYSTDALNPRAVFQECYRQQFITEQELHELLAMISSYNTAIQSSYDEEFAEFLGHQIPNYTQTLDALHAKIGRLISQIPSQK